MGRWETVHDSLGKRLVLHAPDLMDDPEHEAVHLSENEVAKLLLFLQGCHESWSLTPRPPDSSPNPALLGPGP